MRHIIMSNLLSKKRKKKFIMYNDMIFDKMNKGIDEIFVTIVCIQD